MQVTTDPDIRAVARPRSIAAELMNTGTRYSIERHLEGGVSLTREVEAACSHPSSAAYGGAIGDGDVALAQMCGHLVIAVCEGPEDSAPIRAASFLLHFARRIPGPVDFLLPASR